jgi:hypothetical protein
LLELLGMTVFARMNMFVGTAVFARMNMFVGTTVFARVIVVGAQD